ncbi:mannose-6-phosphate isomerase [Halioglobus maricola]|uniref:Cellobiose 2-epimerase n=1 Tax=Halioglobus maricola TaxID=2601894 RepID=A0A5P9NNI4_9GAMM|nr:AGE family epimerase/isomerase [Halioglobus maricola]QFU77332.1 mannose-6-phosphate isomerase [Halioglobus maricola]
MTELDCAPFVVERDRISRWWRDTLFDPAGGFHGAVNAAGEPVGDSHRGLILNTRILWFYSALHCEREDEESLRLARHSYDYILRHFVDSEYGGLFWGLDASGRPLDACKKTYGQAFAIYALSTYFQACGDVSALTLARACFALIEHRARDSSSGGYVETFTRDWQVADDIRLSERDLAAPYSMNAHLHVLEAYTQLCRVDRTADTETALRDVLLLMSERFLGEAETMVMFYDAQWRDCSTMHSYGHDIEASWLWWEAAQVLGDEALSARIRPQVMRLAASVQRRALVSSGRVAEAADAATGHLEPESIWWVQAESLVGFLNAFELSGEQVYMEAFASVWHYIGESHIDKVNGEWHWFAGGVRPDDPAIGYKAGPWKGPYHNGRAMMEVISRLSELNQGRIK